MKMAREAKAAGGRTVVITQGSKPVLVARDTENSVKEYEVPQVEVVDTNGAGDAFTGGFLSQFIQEQPFDTCMKCAIYCASEYVHEQLSNSFRQLLTIIYYYLHGLFTRICDYLCRCVQRLGCVFPKENKFTA